MSSDFNEDTVQYRCCIGSGKLKNVSGGCSLQAMYRKIPREKALAEAHSFGKYGKTMDNDSWRTIGWDEYIKRWNGANPEKQKITEDEVISYSN